MRNLFLARPCNLLRLTTCKKTQNMLKNQSFSALIFYAFLRKQQKNHHKPIMRLNLLKPAILLTLSTLASPSTTSNASANTPPPLNGKISHKAADLQQYPLPIAQKKININPNFAIKNPILSQNPTGTIIQKIQIQFVNSEGQTTDENNQPIQGKTQREFIQGELKVKVGQPFNPHLIEQDIWRLRRLDIFNKVYVSYTQDTAGVTVTYNLEERKYGNFSFGGGNSGDIGLYGRIGYSHTNLNGLNDQLRINTQISGKDFQYRAGFISPYRRFQPNRFGYSAQIFRSREFSSTFNENIDLPNGDDMREGRFGGSLGLLHNIGDWNSQLALNYTRISIRDSDWRVQNIDKFGNPLSLSNTGIDDLLTVSFGIALDQRNRPSNAFQGSLLSFSTEQSLPVGLGEVFMNRLRANYIQYLPVNWLGSGKIDLEEDPELAEVLAFNLQAGTIIGDVIPAETFNLGGLNSVRGYGGAELASGRSFLLGSVEYRFPIIRPVAGVIFADFGTDLGSGDTILGEPGPVRDKPGTGFGYGIGVRVKSPLGLIRGDLGINDQGDIRFEITTGHKF